jgi:hypothetical protein
LSIWTFSLDATHASSKENIIFLTENSEDTLQVNNFVPFHNLLGFFFTHYHHKLKLTHILGQVTHTHTKYEIFLFFLSSVKYEVYKYN